MVEIGQGLIIVIVALVVVLSAGIVFNSGRKTEHYRKANVIANNGARDIGQRNWRK